MLKRLRLILMSLKGYAVVQADYHLGLRNLEEEIKEFHEHLVEEYAQERDQAEQMKRKPSGNNASTSVALSLSQKWVEPKSFRKHSKTLPIMPNAIRKGF